MDMDAERQLKAELDDVTQKRKRLARRIRNEEEKLRRQSDKEENHGFTGTTRFTALSVWWYAGGNVEAGTEYLQRQDRRLRRRHREERTWAELKMIMEDWVLAISCEELGSPETFWMEQMRRRRSVAERFVIELKGVEWVRKLNEEKAIAAPTQDTLVVLEQAAIANLDTEKLKSAFAFSDKTEGGKMKWARRFRKRWRLKIGRFQMREKIDTAELQEKARPRVI